MHEYTTLIKLSNFNFVLIVLNCGYFSGQTTPCFYFEVKSYLSSRILDNFYYTLKSVEIMNYTLIYHWVLLPTSRHHFKLMCQNNCLMCHI